MAEIIDGSTEIIVELIDNKPVIEVNVIGSGPAGPTGPQGPAGQNGADGQDGADGYSPTVTVTDITGGHRVTITDAEGDHTFDVMDGKNGGGKDNVIWATIGTTTYTQITNAVNDNKLVCAKKSLASGKSRIYYCLGKPFDSNYFLFVATTPTTIYSYHVDTEDWTEQLNIDVLKLATTMPLMDGEASAGVLVRAAKADHVHPTDTSRASASDVGDLSDLDTTDKRSIVAAINETLAAGSPSAQEIQDAVDAYLDEHPALTGMFTNAAKNALLSLLEKVAYVDQNGHDYVDNLRTLLAATITSISAVFTQGTNVVYETDDLDTLKSMLVVTATFSDGTTEILGSSDYTLSGTLTAGTSIITVECDNKTDTFSVTVTACLFSLGETAFTGSNRVDTGLTMDPSTTPQYTIVCKFKFTSIDSKVRHIFANYASGSTTGQYLAYQRSSSKNYLWGWPITWANGENLAVTNTEYAYVYTYNYDSTAQTLTIAGHLKRGTDAVRDYSQTEAATSTPATYGEFSVGKSKYQNNTNWDGMIGAVHDFKILPFLMNNTEIADYLGD